MNTLQLQLAGLESKSSGSLSLLSVLFTLIPCFYTLFYRNPFFPFMFFDLGMDFFSCLEHREEMPHCKVPVKITHANTAGFRSLLAFFFLGSECLFCSVQTETQGSGCDEGGTGQLLGLTCFSAVLLFNCCSDFLSLP